MLLYVYLPRSVKDRDHNRGDAIGSSVTMYPGARLFGRTASSEGVELEPASVCTDVSVVPSKNAVMRRVRSATLQIPFPYSSILSVGAAS